MTDEVKNDWERLNDKGVMHCDRLKVDGGYLYRTGTTETVALAFVPDIDLTRYQSHLRDAYTQGFKDGQDDSKGDLRQAYKAGFDEGMEEGIVKGVHRATWAE